MQLYHFTSRYHIKGCLECGLTMGIIPVCYKKKLIISGYQWLTVNKNFNQSWCRFSSLPYDRTEYRIKLQIPKRIRKERLMKWDKYALHFVSEEMKQILNSVGDYYNWYVFRGKISPKYIHSFKQKNF